MVYSGSLHHPAIAELARSGNLRAIAHWLNQALVSYEMRVLVGMSRPGCLKILVEFQRFPEYRKLAEPLQASLVRYVCHRLWQLNSGLIDGVRIAARFAGERQVLWQQSVGIATPARRLRQQQSHKLRTKIRRTTRQKARLKATRTLLMSGSTVAAFLCGGVIAFVKAPVDNSNAVTSPASSPLPSFVRPDVVQTAVENVPVVKHNQVVDPANPTVTLMFGGDVTLSDAFADTVGNDEKWAFAKLDEYRQADLAMVNLENPLTKATSALPGKKFTFKANPDLSAKILQDGGVDLVNLANNHAMDYSTPGLQETIETLNGVGIEYVGAGKNLRDARRPEIIDVKGQRIAYFGYYSADFQSAGPTTPGTNYAEESRISEDIKAVRSQVDWVVVNYHWGEELATHPADWQRKLAHFTIDQGADLVVGHHPHVLQGAEVYKGRPIAYSLGNFIFGGNSRSDYDTAVLKVALKDRQMKVEFLPVEVRKFQPQVVGGDRAQTILKQIADRSGGFQQAMRSPMVLDASQLSPNQPTADAPASSTPTDGTAPTNNSPANNSPDANTGVTPAPVPAGSGNSTNSFSSPKEATGEQNSGSTAPSPAVSPKSPAADTPFTKPADSFTNTPNRTPFNKRNAPGEWNTQGRALPSDPAATPAPSSPSSEQLLEQAINHDPSATPSSTTHANAEDGTAWFASILGQKDTRVAASPAKPSPRPMPSDAAPKTHSSR